MGKNRDLVQILILVIIGMFIPFLGSIIIAFELDITNIDNWLDISKTFGYFLIIFALSVKDKYSKFYSGVKEVCYYGSNN